MAEEVVVTQNLSDDMIAAGAQLIGYLDQAQFPVQAAVWLYRPESELWRLMIASPGVKSEGPRKAYARLQVVLTGMPENHPRVGLQNISIVDAQDPFISLLRTAIRTGPGISSIRFSRNMVNGTYVEDAYIYKLT